MTFISYAQNYEDVMLWRALKHIDKGFYIDVGAAWPSTDNVTKAFYMAGWRGVNIEPNEDLCRLLEFDRPEDVNLKVALGDKAGQLTINFLGNQGLSTGDENIAKQHIARGETCFQRDVEVRTLKGIWEEYVPDGQEVHFLKIDVEGLERAVIQGLDWSRRRPWLVVVEATYPMSTVESHGEWEYLLLNQDYSLVYCDGLNRFYAASEHQKIASIFKYPPNIWDDFKQWEYVELSEKYRDACEQLESIKTEKKYLEQSLQHLYLSRSWRLTAPLRAVFHFVKKFRDLVERS